MLVPASILNHKFEIDGVIVVKLQRFATMDWQGNGDRYRYTYAYVSSLGWLFDSIPTPAAQMQQDVRLTTQDTWDNTLLSPEITSRNDIWW